MGLAERTPPTAEEMAKIKSPVYGFYAGNDARVTNTVEKAAADMQAAGKTYETATYEGAGHGFMRFGEAPAPAADAAEKDRTSYAANKKAHDEAWTKIKAVLGKL